MRLALAVALAGLVAACDVTVGSRPNDAATARDASTENDVGPSHDGGDDGGTDALVAPSGDAARADDVGASDAGPPPGASCVGGGEMAGSSGAEAPLGEAVVGLCRMALGCSSTWSPHAPPESMRTSGTPNQKLLWRVWSYEWAVRSGDAAAIDAERAFLLAFFTAQDTNGHQAPTPGANEILTTSHYEIWSNGMVCARLLAFVNDDAALLDATGAWWRGEEALYDVLDRGGSIDAPGARFGAGQAGPSQLRDTLHAMIEGRTPAGRPGDPSAPWWDQYYNVSAWMLRNLFAIGDDLGGARGATASDLPLLSDGLHVWTSGGDWVFEFHTLHGALQPIFWVASIGGTVTRSDYVSGTPTMPTTPPPVLAGASELVVPGVAP